MTAFSVDASDPGKPPRVLVNGVEVEGVVGVSLQAEYGQASRFRMLLTTGFHYVGDAVVEVVEDKDQRQAVVGWLANVDPDQLSKAVLERMGAGSSSTVAEALAALRVLAGDPTAKSAPVVERTCLICDAPVNGHDNATHAPVSG